MASETTPSAPVTSPPIFNYIVGFLLIGIAWGFTTPFIRRAARSHTPPPHPILADPAVQDSWIKSKIYGAFFGVVDLLRNPRYAIPLVINLTGSIWFFLLIGQAGMFSRRLSCLLTMLVMLNGVADTNCCCLSCRIESHSTNHKFLSFLIHGIGRLVGRRKGHWKGYASTSLMTRRYANKDNRYMDWDDAFTVWNSALCTE